MVWMLVKFVLIWNWPEAGKILTQTGVLHGKSLGSDESAKRMQIGRNPVVQ